MGRCFSWMLRGSRRWPREAWLLAAWLALLPVGALAAAAGDARAVLDDAMRAAAKGDWSWARHVAGDLAGGQMATYFRWRELLEGEPRPSFGVFASFLERNRDWPSLGTLQVRAEETIDDTVPHEAVLRFFKDRQPRTRPGRVRLAQALIATDRSAEARALLRQSWVEDDFGAAEEASFLERHASFLERGDHAARLDRLLWDGRHDAARRMLGRVDRDRRALAEARLALQQSAPGVDRLVAAVPAGLQGDAGLLFDRLRWRREKGSMGDVIEVLTAQPSALGRPDAWWREQQRVVRELIDQRDMRRAYRVAAAHRQQQGTGLAEAEWLAGWLALRFLDDAATARRHFERIWPNVSTPISRARAAYWSGRAAAGMKDSDTATGWYERAARLPQTFYGQLAAAEAGVDPGSRLGPSRQASAATRAALLERAPTRVGLALCSLGQAAYAQPFFRHLGHDAGPDRDMLAAIVEAAKGCGRADLVLAAARAAVANGGEAVDEAFPVPPFDSFRERRPGLPEPALVMAVARQESLFDPQARSPAGALGLMQLMPGTAQGVTRKLGLPYSKARLLQDPNYNIRLGSTYLQQQLDRFDGEAALALAAYNAGPSRVVRWLESYGDPRRAGTHRLIDWIELIPFTETRNYVQRVMEGWGMYRLLTDGRKRQEARQAAAQTGPVPRPKPET